MDENKPLPLMLNGHARYTLTSYEPVSIVVEVPRVTDQDVSMGLVATVLQEGGTPQLAESDVWIHQHFPEVSGVQQMREIVREQLAAMNEQLMENQKAEQCAAALAQRLVQKVPAAEVAKRRRMIANSIVLGLADGKITEDALAEMGLEPYEFEMMLSDQAKTMAEREAAVMAWAEHFGVSVSASELATYLGASSAEDANRMILEFKLRGQLDELQRTAVVNKALEMVVAECQCTYHEEPKYPHLKLV